MRVLKPLQLASVVVLVPLIAACARTNPPISQAQLPLGGEAPIALPSQQNDQALRVTLQDGRLDSSVYSEQSGATQMIVISTDGPYVFQIDRLVERREIPAFGSAVIHMDTSAPGDFTIHAYRSSSDGSSSLADTAVLRVTPVGQ